MVRTLTEYAEDRQLTCCASYNDGAHHQITAIAECPGSNFFFFCASEPLFNLVLYSIDSMHMSIISVVLRVHRHHHHPPVH